MLNLNYHHMSVGVFLIGIEGRKRYGVTQPSYRKLFFIPPSFLPIFVIKERNKYVFGSCVYECEYVMVGLVFSFLYMSWICPPTHHIIYNTKASPLAILLLSSSLTFVFFPLLLKFVTPLILISSSTFNLFFFSFIAASPSSSKS